MKTKKEVIQLSLSELIRQKHRGRLRRRLDKTDIQLTLTGLEDTPRSTLTMNTDNAS